jgi:hypothetical protein
MKELTTKHTFLEELQQLHGAELVKRLESTLPMVKGLLDGVDDSVMALEREKNRIIALIKSHKENKAFVKDALLELMINEGVDKVNMGGLVAFIRMTRSLVVDDVNLLSDGYVKTVKTANKKKINEDHSVLGILPEGCSYAKNVSLTITKERDYENNSR